MNSEFFRLKRRILLGLATALFAIAWHPARAQTDMLASWNDTAPKQAIVDFVGKVTKPGGPDFVAPAERIAVFDNDGTLWAEQPLYFQFMFMADRIRALAPQHQEWRETEPYASVLRGDMKGLAASGEKGLMQLMAATHAGMTTDEFSAIVSEWMATARHPKTGKPYTSMVYQPMLELLAYLRANGFKTYIVSGGGQEFIRPWAEGVYGIPPEQVIGSHGELEYQLRNGQPVLVKQAKVALVDDKAGKPVGIQRFIGRRPVFAFGNSDGDLQMLEWTTAGEGPRFGAIVHHTDAAREWAYDRQSKVGTLDQALDAAAGHRWTVVDMAKDWKVVFPAEPQRGAAR